MFQLPQDLLIRILEHLDDRRDRQAAHLVCSGCAHFAQTLPRTQRCCTPHRAQYTLPQVCIWQVPPVPRRWATAACLALRAAAPSHPQFFVLAPRRLTGLGHLEARLCVPPCSTEMLQQTTSYLSAVRLFRQSSHANLQWHWQAEDIVSVQSCLPELCYLANNITCTAACRLHLILSFPAGSAAAQPDADAAVLQVPQHGHATWQVR